MLPNVFHLPFNYVNKNGNNNDRRRRRRRRRRAAPY